MAQLPPVTSLYKLVMDFRSPAGKGWSEGHYLPTGSTTALEDAARTIVDYRLALLPPDCALVYCKYSQLGGDRDANVIEYAFPKAGTWPGDPFVTPATAPEPGSLTIEVAEIAVSLRIFTPTGLGANRWVHAVPDNRVNGEVLTDAIAAATVAPPAIGGGTFSTDWAVRFGYLMYHLKALTVYGQKQRGPGGVPQWGTATINKILVRGVVSKRIGRPFGVPRGRALTGR